MRAFRTWSCGMLLLAAGIGTAWGGMRELEPGAAIALKPDEGLLLIAVDTRAPVQAVRVRRNGALFDGGLLRGVEPGVTMRLFSAPAGRYRFDQVRTGLLRYTLGEDPEFGFEVKPGVINYPGHLRFEPVSWIEASAHVTNRALAALDWIEQQHPPAAREFALEYVGHYPDAFPAFYRAARAQHSAAVAARAAPPPDPDSLPVTVDTLWQPGSVSAVDMNDPGDLLAMVVRSELATTPTWSIEIVDLQGWTSHRVLDVQMPITSVVWAGARSLVVRVGAGGGSTLVFVRVGGEPGARRFQTLRPRRALELVDVIAGDSDHVLVATRSGRRDALRVHRLDISSQQAIDRFGFALSDAIDRGVSGDLAWLSDGRGTLSAALARRDGKLVMLLRGADGDYRAATGFDADSGVWPLGLSADARTLYGRSDKGREQRDLVEYDLEKGTITRTRFSRAGVDVQGAVFDPDGTLVGATYYEGGQLVSEYFDPGNARMYATLAAAFPGRSVTLLDRDAAARNVVLLVDAADQPGVIYHFDVAQRQASELRDISPWIDDTRLAPSRLLRATSRDGLAIEAYLTLPRGARGKLPLVVYPHGGPVGVRDTRHFRPDVQFLAALGYAVLQVNFRGSEGYGASFRDAGRRSYGSRIEDDIDAALTLALAEHPLDASRMCIVGSSYGGYSALISAIRWPERFRCAISIAGVSDLALFFTASDSGRSAEGREVLENTIGDPRKDAAMMQAFSPLYRYEGLSLPVMLVHGEQDVRVDFEHSRRLQRMLNLRGITPVMLTFENEAHGVVHPANRRRLWSGVAGFLRQHLGSTPAAGTD